MALNAQRPSDHLPVDHNQVAADIEALHHASKKHDEVCYYLSSLSSLSSSSSSFHNALTWFQVAFFEILINRSNAHIAAV